MESTSCATQVQPLHPRGKNEQGGRGAGGGGLHTESIFKEIVESMPVTCICEFVVVGRQLLQTLDRNRAEIPRIRCILGQHHCAPGYKAVYKRFRPHLSVSLCLSLSLCVLKPFLLSLKNQPSSYSFPTIVIPSPATTSTFTPPQNSATLHLPQDL